MNPAARAKMDEPASHMLDLAFETFGGTVPDEPRRALAAALSAALPWLALDERAGVHPLRLAGISGQAALLSRRTRLLLRVPREHLAQALALSGTTLHLGTHALRLGAAQPRELLPLGTLFAHLVASDGQDAGDELAFHRRMAAELEALGVRGRTICGRHQAPSGSGLQGWALMIDQLSAAHSLRVQESGLGQHRLLGCGIFVPHKSAAAVGTPD